MKPSGIEGGPVGRPRPTVIYSVASSLDGFVAAVDGGVDWLAPFMKPGDDYGFDEFVRSVDAVLIGGRTYEQMLGFGGDPMAWMGRPCWVFSGRDLPSTSPSVAITSGPPEAVLDDLAGRGIARCWLMGGTKLATSFRSANLISEYGIGLIPVVLGSGLPLFESPGPPATLELIESTARLNGVVQLRYRAT